MPNDPLTLAKALCAIESTTGAEGPVVQYLDELLCADGWATRRIPVTPGRDALLATAGDGPFVTLSTHLDTVPPYIPPRLEADVLHGRGACDAKGIAAAMVCAAERIRARGESIALLLLVGEEVSHDGAHAANAWARETGFRSIALINGEPTESTLALGTKGALRVVVRTEGRAAHSAYPELGESATMKLVDLLGDLPSLALPTDEQLGETTVNVGFLSGGVADNVIAPSAEARLMIRLVSPAETVTEALEQWIAGRATMEAGTRVPFVRLGTLPGYATSVAKFATDVPNLPAFGTPYLYGPGSIHVAHTDHEFVTGEELRQAVTVYDRMVGEIRGRRTTTPVPGTEV